MKGQEHASQLRLLSQELVELAERRAGLKAELAAFKTSRKGDSHTPRARNLRKRIRELSGKIDSVVDKIGQPPPRRMERWSGVLPVTLHVETKGRKFEHPASTLDMSDRGLRIVTATSLIPGQTLDVFSNRSRLGHFRVVWVAGAGTDRPSEVGLEILH